MPFAPRATSSPPPGGATSSPPPGGPAVAATAPSVLRQPLAAAAAVEPRDFGEPRRHAAERPLNPRIAKLDLEGEASKLRQALREAAACANVDVELQVRTATVDAFQSAVTLGPRVLHFAGHGEESFLMVEDGHGSAHALEPTGAAVHGVGLWRGDMQIGGVKLVQERRCWASVRGRGRGTRGRRGAGPEQRQDFRSRGHRILPGFYRSLASLDTVRTAFDIGCAAAQKNMRGEAGSDGRFVLLPEDQPHDEAIFSEIPGSFRETTRPPPPSNAPPPPTFYVGRDSELWVCVESILNHRLTTIGGGYGSGKSALAAKAAAHVSQHQNFDAVVWVKVTTTDRFFDDVAMAASHVIERAGRPPCTRCSTGD